MRVLGSLHDELSDHHALCALRSLVADTQYIVTGYGQGLVSDNSHIDHCLVTGCTVGRTLDVSCCLLQVVVGGVRYSLVAYVEYSNCIQSVSASLNCQLAIYQGYLGALLQYEALGQSLQNCVAAFGYNTVNRVLITDDVVTADDGLDGIQRCCCGGEGLNAVDAETFTPFT